MRRQWWGAGLAALVMPAAAAPASAGTYEVVSCGAVGAGGVNRAWRVIPGFDDRFFDSAPTCPELSAWSERRPGVVAPNFTGAGFQLSAPPGAILDRMVIWRTGYRFSNTGSAQGPWVVQGYRADGSVLGGPLSGETCLIEPGQISCRFGERGAMAPGARSERDLETPQVLYSVVCFDPPGCSTANDQGFPFAGLSISGSIVTVRDTARPAVVARGALLAPGWRTDDRPLSFGASDPVRATATDAVGHAATVIGAPVRLRAGFGRRMRAATRAGLTGRVLVRGRLRAGDGAPLAGRAIAIQQRPRVDGAAFRPPRTVITGRRGTFRIRVPAGASRVVRVTSPGTAASRQGCARCGSVSLGPPR